MLYQEFIEKVKEFEGLRLKSYRCPSGVWTVGYGHTHSVKPNMTITKREADVFFLYDLWLVRFQLQVLHPKLVVGSGLYYALVDFVFNFGISKYQCSTLKKVVDNIKDYFNLSKTDIASLSVQFLRWSKSNGKTLRGLERRRLWEISLFKM